MSNLKTSLLVAQQVPEYVSDEYPLFVSFLEAYYEFMETAQGTQKNNVLSLGKNMRYISDVDVSIGAFEKSFFNNFASLIPRDVEINKEYEYFFKNNFKRIEIKKTAVLEEKKFRTGIKIDNELLREYFRNHV